jgi:endonuclease/exonuclease/phosphatase (EEP) superfamily protein YafD
MRAPRPERRRRAAVAAAVPWAAWATVRATGSERGFPLVPAMSFTPHAAATALLPLALAVRARSGRAVLLSAAAAVALAANLRTHPGRQPAPVTRAAPAADRLRVATISLRKGHVPAAAVVDLVRRHGVDVLAVAELTPECERRIRGAGLERLLPHAHAIPAGPGKVPAASGAVWSRRPITARSAVPGGFEQPTVRLASPAGEVEVTAVHATPPAISPAQVRTWTADLTALPSPEPGVLRVLAGDFNATPDHAAFRAVLARGYRDAAAAVGRGRAWTWRPMRLLRPRLPLDHVLVDPRITVDRVDLVPVRGSDHRAVVADLDLPGRRA